MNKLSNLSKREKVLLIILIILIFISLVSVYSFLQNERLKKAEGTINMHAKLLTEIKIPSKTVQSYLDKISAGKEKLLEIKKSLYKTNEIDDFEFGQKINSLLSRHNIQVNEYKIRNISGKTYLDYAVNGKNTGIMNFLLDVSREQKRWMIPSINIQSKKTDDELKVFFRITYGVLNEEN